MFGLSSQNALGQWPEEKLRAGIPEGPIDPRVLSQGLPDLKVDPFLWWGRYQPGQSPHPHIPIPSPQLAITGGDREDDVVICKAQRLGKMDKTLL